MNRMMKKLTALLCTAALGLNMPCIAAFAEEGASDSLYEITDEDIAGYTYTPQFAFPSQMRGITITPTIDYVRAKEEGGGYTEAEVYEELNKLFDRAAAKAVNTLIVDTDLDGAVFYDTDVNSSVSRSIVDYTAEAALDRGFYVYLKFDISAAMDKLGDDMSLKEKMDRLAIIIRNITVKYTVDGIIFEGYYSESTPESFGSYMDNGSGIGYENWLYDSNAYLFSLASEAVRRTSSAVPVGIAVNDVWANSATSENGSDTSADFEALTDGYADTLSYVQKGYADFILLGTEEGFSSDTVPFEEIVSWWDKAATEADIRLIVSHENENVCTGEKGWDYPDELVKQVIAAEEYGSCKGSVFTSLDALEEDKQQSTEVLMKHYNNDIDLEGLNSELEMTLPESTDFRTEDTSVIFAGTFDPNFDVYFQGELIELNEAGRFYFNMDLEVGENTFTFENKGKTVTYNITRTVKVLKNAEPRGDDIYIDGGSQISLSAVAYKGSSVIAYINGEKVRLKEAEGLSDDIDPNSSYTKYIGTYTVPEGAKGSVTDLGYIKIYGAYPVGDDKILECITGSRLYINEIYVPPEVLEVEESIEVIKASAGGVIQIVSDNTMVWSGNNTQTEPEPDCTRLPAGTVDYVMKTVTYGSSEYYITGTGRRINTSDATAVDFDISADSPLTLSHSGVSGGDTELIFDLKNKVPFEVKYGGISYNSGGNGSFYIDSFDSETISLEFDYISQITDNSQVYFSEGAVFTSGVWDTYDSGGLPKARLTLTLSSRGAYNGVKSYYNGSGQLVISFNGKESSLSGMTIVIDPGHGYVGNGVFDPGAVGHVKEQEINLAVAKLVEQKLAAAGANVIRLQTESTDYVTAKRAEYARQYDPDMYISVHCNSAGANAKGAEAYYFMPFSQPLAERISARLGAVLNDVHGGGDMDRGEKYNYFYVTQQQEFPSVLVETAFVSNYTEAMALADPYYQDRFAEAIVLGIEDYLYS